MLNKMGEKEIIDLVKNLPNDQELGKEIRKIINKIKKNNGK